MSDQRTALSVVSELKQLLEQQEAELNGHKRKTAASVVNFVLESAFQNFDLPSCSAEDVTRMAKRLKPTSVPEGIEITRGAIKAWARSKTGVRRVDAIEQEPESAPTPPTPSGQRVLKRDATMIAIRMWVIEELKARGNEWMTTSDSRKEFIAKHPDMVHSYTTSVFNPVLESLEAEGVIVFMHPKPLLAKNRPRYFRLASHDPEGSQPQEIVVPESPVSETTKNAPVEDEHDFAFSNGTSPH
jgi:hypothetical protein